MRRRERPRVRALAAALAIALAPCAAHAEAHRDVPQRARALAEAGRTYHGQGDYRHAIEAFEEAYVIAPSPGLLFDLAQAHRLAGHCREAAWLYRRYLATNPTEDRAALARAELEVVARCAERALPTPAVAAARTDARPLAVAAPRPEPDAPDDGLRERHLGIGLAIGGGVGLVAAIAFAIDGGASPANATDDAAFAKLFGIAGGLAVAGGAAIYAAGWYESHHQVAVTPRPGGAVVHASWKF